MTDADYLDYDSAQMFPGCDCGHDATDHACGNWSEDFTGCKLCGCDVEWEWS